MRGGRKEKAEKEGGKMEMEEFVGKREYAGAEREMEEEDKSTKNWHETKMKWKEHGFENIEEGLREGRGT